MTTIEQTLPGRPSHPLALQMRVVSFCSRFLTEDNALPIALGLSILAGVGDALTGAEATFTLFYIVPIAIAGWFRGRRSAMLVVAVSEASALAGHILLEPHPSSWIFMLWNAAMELGLFIAFSYALGFVRARVDAEVALRRSALNQLRHAERLNTLGKLASGLAHEMGTPLNVISGRADMIVDGQVELEGARASAKIIGVQAQRIATLVRHLLAFARRGGTRKSSEPVLALCRETVELLAGLARQKNVELRVRGDGAVALVNRSEIQQVVSNLIANAVHATASGGTIEVTTGIALTRLEENADQVDRSYALIQVRDHGTGIAPSILPYIFDPFFTTKEVGEGTGLGLSIAFGIIRDHGGAIRVISALGDGTTFLVYLPR